MEMLWFAVAFAGAVLVHALLIRLPVRGDAVLKFLAGGGAIGMLLAVALPWGERWHVSLAALALYAFSCELYIFLFTLVGSSVSVKILWTLRSGPRSPAEIDGLYRSDVMVDDRVARMQSIGLLDAQTGQVTPRGRLLVSIFLALKQFFRHPLPTPEPPSSAIASISLPRVSSPQPS